MTTIINVNGRITPARDAVVPALDHGFLYGEGIYEVVRTYNHKPFLFDRHMARLRRSAASISLVLPFDDDGFATRIRETANVFFRQADATEDVYVRLLVTRGVGEMNYNPAFCLTPTVVVIVKAFTRLDDEVYTKGVCAALVPVMRLWESFLISRRLES